MEFTSKQLVSFGQYLLSEERKNRILSNPQVDELLKQETLKMVHDADIENWKETQK